MNKNKVVIENAYDYNLNTLNNALDVIFADLGYDLENPFKTIIKPGDKVFIKPNWVGSSWRKSADHVDTMYSVITHENLIEVVADKVAIALKGKGEIIIGDNPSIDANFNELLKFTNIKHLESKYNVPCHIIDMRPLVCDDLKNYGKKDLMVSQLGDPLGEVQINLGKESLLYNVDSSLFRGVFDEREDTVRAHTKDTQLYTFGKSLYDADVYISLPKMKAHQKVGATLNLKGLVGSVTDKNQLVHWRIGSPETGGDEYANQFELEESKKAVVTHRGSWPGNDTIWRMVVDLYNCMLKKDRKYFSIVDGICGGEGQGPFCPTSKYSHVLVAGEDLLNIDIVSARLMGFDPTKIKYLNYFLENNYTSLKSISVISHNKEYSNDFFNNLNPYLDYAVIDKWNDIKIKN